MGGTVSVTIRRENGQVTKLSARTGSYSALFFSKEFSSKEFDKAIDKYIDILNQSEYYNECDYTAPDGYGIVVIDFKLMKIYSHQSYDSPGIDYFTPAMERYNTDINANTLAKEFGSEEVKRLYEVLNCSSNIGQDDLFKIIRKSDLGKQYELYEENLNLFERYIYEENFENMVDMFVSLKNDGFKFNSDEVKMWKDFAYNLSENNDIEPEELESKIQLINKD